MEIEKYVEIRLTFKTSVSLIFMQKKGVGKRITEHRKRERRTASIIGTAKTKANTISVCEGSFEQFRYDIGK